jgi:hypothetical protein
VRILQERKPHAPFRPLPSRISESLGRVSLAVQTFHTPGNFRKLRRTAGNFLHFGRCGGGGPVSLHTNAGSTAHAQLGQRPDELPSSLHRSGPEGRVTGREPKQHDAVKHRLSFAASASEIA